MRDLWTFKSYSLLAMGFILLLALPFTLWHREEKPQPLPKNDTINPYALPEDAAAALIQKAAENYFYREFKEGAENYRKAIALYEARQDASKVARTYHSLGDLYLWARNPEAGEKSYIQAANYHIQAKDPLGQANDLIEIGEIHRKVQRFKRAEEWYQKSLLALAGTGPNRVFGRVYEARGHNHWQSQDIPRAIEAFSQARKTYAALNYQLGIQHMSNVLERLRNGDRKIHRHALRGGEFRDGYRPH